MTTDQIIFGLAVFLLAGTVKGLVGLGLPTIVIALTTLVLPLTEAIAMIALPTIFSNVWQAKPDQPLDRPRQQEDGEAEDDLVGGHLTPDRHRSDSSPPLGGEVG